MTVQELQQAFVDAYGNKEDAIYFSPGRVNLIGEHTDYNGGPVFPCALSFGTYLLLRKNASQEVNFRSLNETKGFTVPLPELTELLEKGAWANYPVAVFDQFLQKGIQFTEGFDILIWGNVPLGAGLSSSAALEVVTAFALNDQMATGYDRAELAKMGRKAEHKVGVMCGIMDQFVSAHGKKGHAVFLNCDTLEFELVPVKLEGIKVVISNTHSPHKLDGGKYNERVAQCQLALKQLQTVRPELKNLAELTQVEFDEIMAAITDPVALKRARHVVGEVQRTADAVKELKAGNINKFGLLMNASHDSLRDDYEVTGEFLDTLVEEARKIDGVIGSRMTGGGFGGCTVSLVKEEAIDAFKETVGAAYQAKTGLIADFYIAEIGDGAKKIN